MTERKLENILESILFASEEELSLKQLKDLLDICKVPSTYKEIEGCIMKLNDEYSRNGNAFEIIQLAGGYQFATKREFAQYVGEMRTVSYKKKLSAPALETLAIIAYKQPIARSEIEFIRGVNVDYIVNSLLEKDLIMIKGRASTPGRPILYGTTANFLKILGLNSLDDLPKLREINDILKNEKIEGISEADIDLFDSINTEEIYRGKGQESLNFKDQQNNDGNQETKENGENTDKVIFNAEIIKTNNKLNESESTN
ncbi:MAG: SMC-Scp complex subunit ScpB [Ignavibacteria bacterium]|nr:SMC-Scp complex subunit ScpB [Ignavibacteria bacterium]